MNNADIIGIILTVFGGLLIAFGAFLTFAARAGLDWGEKITKGGVISLIVVGVVLFVAGGVVYIFV